MKFPTPLLKGTLLRRYRRFLADVRLPDGTTVTAHCANSGSLVGCSEPGRPVVVSNSGNLSRRHPLTWELIDMHGTWVGVNPLFARKVVLEAIEHRRVIEFASYDEMQRDATYGIKSRTKIDAMLHGMDYNTFINIHSVTWGRDGVALFPDASNSRARRSMRELATVATNGHRAAAVFIILRGDCSMLKPAEEVDREFLRAMLTAQNRGVSMLAYRAHITDDGIDIGSPVPCSLE